MSARPIADNLFTEPDQPPALIGGCCQACGAYSFPVPTGCPRCGATRVEPRQLHRAGTLWTWTSQGFLPKAPFSGTFMADPFEPWYVGLIDLPGQLRVESILIGCTQDTLHIGMPMRLVTMPFGLDDAGGEVVTFAFAPAETAAEQDMTEAHSTEATGA